MIARIGTLITMLGAPLLVMVGASGVARQQPDHFDHARHAKLFVTCSTCHVGITRPGAPVFPAPAACATCHNGATERRVSYIAPTAPRPSNLKFSHAQHAALRRAAGDTSGSCDVCHADAGASWMQVHGPQPAQCVACHTQGRGQHLTLPDTACATCHLPLAQATTLSVARVRAFPKPPSHDAPDFMTASGHGALARHGSATSPVAQSCATCHARDFCVTCHVDAPEVPAIQALAPDARSLALPHRLLAPASHSARNFETTHGRLAGPNATSCRTCHTQESCITCHRAEAPAAVLALYHAGAGRGPGAQTVARQPTSHLATNWATQHGPVASASMRSCTTCHTRTECLVCHKPDPGNRGGYHPPGFLTTHPSDAYTRSSSCSDCHNTGQFCQTCHQQSGLTARRTLLGAAGYHDGNRQFFLGHGQAARQALESCVSCHTERDCLTCHSVVGGRGFDPHGPGFNPVEMLRRNPQLCITCHGRAIPTQRPTP